MMSEATVAIRKIAILNRGEPAVRFCRALADYNVERGTELRSVAMYTTADAGTPFTILADEAHHLGSALVEGPEGGLVSAYLDFDRVLAALRTTGCDAVWPGWGFIAEDAAFVARLEAAGIVFLGPSSTAMERLGDKIAAKALAEECGVPLAPWWELPQDYTDEELTAQAERIGFPLMVKASAGGGGRGIRKVNSFEELSASISAVHDEVKKVFGAGGILLEACVTDARHVEVQLLCGADGNAVALGVRDCSVQRRNQKIFEETPSPTLPDDMAKLLCESSVRLAKAAGYVSAGTAEFLYQPATGLACFLEVNSRLQVEHTVTECVTGVDLVHGQIDAARGLPLAGCGAIDADGAPPTPRGWAIEARLCAEDASRGFAPAPGRVTVFRPPSGPGVRVDSGVTEGSNIAAEFDSMIAKVIATGATRNQAIARLRRALTELQVVVEDGATNKALLLELLEHPGFIRSELDTGWLDRALVAGDVAQGRRVFEALCFAAVVEYRRRRHADVQAFLVAAQGGVPQHPPKPEPLDVDLAIGGQRLSLRVHDFGATRFLVGPAGREHLIKAEFDGEHSATLWVAGERLDVSFAYGDKGVTVEIDGAMHTVEPAAGGAVKAPAPAMVVQVLVEEGHLVQAGDRLLTLEAMKLEMPLLAAEAGVVRAVLCNPNQQVNAGQVLVVLESDEEGGADAASDLWVEPVSSTLQRIFDAGPEALVRIDALDDHVAKDTLDDLWEAIRSVLLGYDVSEEFASQAAKLLGGALDFEAMRHPERWMPVMELLRCFAEVQVLFDRTPRAEGASTVSDHSLFFETCRLHQQGLEGVPEGLQESLERAMAWYGAPEQGQPWRDSLFRLHVAYTHNRLRHELCSLLLRAAIDLQLAGVAVGEAPGLAQHLDIITRLSDPKLPFVKDNAAQAEYLLFVQPRYARRRQELEQRVDAALSAVDLGAAGTSGWVDALISAPEAVSASLLMRLGTNRVSASAGLMVLMQRTYGQYAVELGEVQCSETVCSLFGSVNRPGAGAQAVCGLLVSAPGDDWRSLEQWAKGASLADDAALDVFLAGEGYASLSDSDLAQGAGRLMEAATTRLERVTFLWCEASGAMRQRTYGRGDDVVAEDELLRDIHPAFALRFELHRLANFNLTRLETQGPVYAYLGVARDNPRDERIFAYGCVRDVPDALTSRQDPGSLSQLEHVYYEALRVIRDAQSSRDRRRRLHWNRLTLYVREPVKMGYDDICALSHRLDSATSGLGLEKVIVRAHLATEANPTGDDTAVVIARPGKHRLQVSLHQPAKRPVRAMGDFEMSVVRARRFGFVYPYELIHLLTGERSGTDNALPHPDLRTGTFAEYDLSADGLSLEPVTRPYGENSAAVVVGTITNPTVKHPEGMTRVLIVNDPTQAMCALAEPECRRILAAMELATELDVPIEWVSISAGAKIAMDSGTENLDWTARVLKGLIEHTQRGGVIHVIVAGVNVGAQSYWNAEATMLMHTKGLLIMTEDGSCVLTGKKALEVSGSVAAEDERGIGGWERVMGPNGQAQLFASNLGEAYFLLMEHYRFTWTAPGADGPARFETTDPVDRDICAFPYTPGGRSAEEGGEFATVGEVFSTESNPGRKKPFDVRAVMRAVIDNDGGHLERFTGMSEGETSVIWDAHVGGWPVCVIGFESRPLRRRGRIPTDGPDTWTGGTLFPQSSKKVARAINAASGNRPVVVLANLSGFDGSPESLRRLQLEYGAEIGRAVVNFDGPIVFVVIGRYHGGAYVVFSKALNPNLTALALTGSYASVIGGGPAAAVVFPREVRGRAARDPRVLEAGAAMKNAAAQERPRLREQLDKLRAQVTLEMQGQVAEEFDGIHTVERAVEVGSLDAVISPSALRPVIIAKLQDAAQG